ncbi:YgiT-type zinc finger protein [Bacillus sp. Cr_A10]|uniref:YgiT-type zinc finger protein n=1 Tax=Bacillus sp. Cr_A10 TaxID=3033993 RepID=UPI0023DB026E|nr:YgiT-type zinc finger protein [Bacillus sp. Cr_A10]MDF2066524.1 YgiT-type zinc finger protein [Bacillus sp. Cr_A10]
MKCPNCNKEREIRFITKSYKTKDDKQVTIHGIPATACECDTYVSIPNMLLVEKYLNEQPKIIEDLSFVYFDSIKL